ncbi:MAG: hypothetical protein ACHQRM_07260 [Bacteroidia bacterium]
MKTTELRKELHFAIDSIQDESLLEAVYTILNKGMNDYELSGEQKKELTKRLESHEKGLSSNIPWKKSLKTIRSKVVR